MSLIDTPRMKGYQVVDGPSCLTTIGLPVYPFILVFDPLLDRDLLTVIVSRCLVL